MTPDRRRALIERFAASPVPHLRAQAARMRERDALTDRVLEGAVDIVGRTFARRALNAAIGRTRPARDP